ncbi:CD63 protein, partial [Polypterus senegalus]|nr:CD63 protein [Polypterus senegalus]
MLHSAAYCERFRNHLLESKAADYGWVANTFNTSVTSGSQPSIRFCTTEIKSKEEVLVDVGILLPFEVLVALKDNGGSTFAAQYLINDQPANNGTMRKTGSSWADKEGLGELISHSRFIQKMLGMWTNKSSHLPKLYRKCPVTLISSVPPEQKLIPFHGYVAGMDASMRGAGYSHDAHSGLGYRVCGLKERQVKLATFGRCLKVSYILKKIVSGILKKQVKHIGVLALLSGNGRAADELPVVFCQILSKRLHHGCGRRNEMRKVSSVLFQLHLLDVTKTSNGSAKAIVGQGTFVFAVRENYAVEGYEKVVFPFSIFTVSFLVVNEKAFLISEICGLILIIIGIVVQVQLNKTLVISNAASSGAPVVLIVIGGVIFLVSFFGCCGAWKENHCMITMFAILLTLVFIVEIAAVIAGYVFKDKVKPVLNISFQEMIREYSQSKEIQQNVDFLQSSFQCCGGNGSSDWRNATSSNIPVSCCNTTSSPKNCNTADPGQIYSQLLGIIFACMLMKAIRSGYEVM